MRIGLNGQKLLTANPAGPEKYTYHIYKALARVDKNNDYVVYFPNKPPKEFWNTLTCSNKNFSYQVVKHTFSWTQFALALELFKHPVDVFFTPIHTLPGFHPAKTKIVSMIHGLEYVSNKELSAFHPKRLMYPFILLWLLIFSKKIVVPSQATLQAIISKWPFINKDKFSLITEGVDEKFYTNNFENPHLENIKHKYGLDNFEYFLSTSTIQPRKNIPRLIEGFAISLKNRWLPQNLVLAFAGKYGWNYQESLDVPKKFGIDSNVRFLGYVPDEDLPALTLGAKGYTNASLEEGFGLTVIEAMAMNKPCAVSDIAAHKEVGGTYPIYFDPKNPEAIAQALKELYNTEPTNEGTRLAQQYSWQESAVKLLAEFEKCLN